MDLRRQPDLYNNDHSINSRKIGVVVASKQPHVGNVVRAVICACVMKTCAYTSFLEHRRPNPKVKNDSLA